MNPAVPVINIFILGVGEWGVEVGEWGMENRDWRLGIGV